VLKIEIHDAPARARLAELARRIERPQPLMKAIGEMILTSTDERFRREVDPEGRRWKPLRPGTVKRKRRRGKIMKVLQQDQYLRNRISYRTRGRSVVISSVLPYAAIHQFGGRAGRGRKAKIPARPYLGVSREDWAEIERMTAEYLEAEGN